MPLPLRSLRLTATRSSRGYDVDAATYIRSVENADGQTLEPAVKAAINAFVLGCKADGIWTAIKASCVLMGARTLSGALTPLVGTAPVNENFVSGDYNRKTGLIGDGSTKAIDTSRNNNQDPQNSFHLSVYVTTIDTSANNRYYIGDLFETGWSGIYRAGVNTGFASRRNGGEVNRLASVGFMGFSRATSSTFISRIGQTDQTSGVTSQTPSGRRLRVFASTNNGPAEVSNARIAFYSIGESISLSSLNSRLVTLYDAIGAAIP
jgi:hypothetical protein